MFVKRKKSMLMFKRSFIVLGLISLLFNSCSTEFDVTSDWKETAIVYGMLDASQDVQYIRVGKAFLDESTSALIIAGIQDSLYFKPENTQVYLKEVVGNSEISHLLELDKTIPRDSGLFAWPEQLLYKFDKTINKKANYYLEIETPLKNTVTSFTPIVDSFFLLRPLNRQRVDLSNPRGFEMIYEVPENGLMHELTMRAHFNVYRKSDTSLLEKAFVDWQILINDIFPNSSIANGTFRTNIVGLPIFEIMKKNIAVRNDVWRSFVGIEFIISVGSEELSNYIRVNTGGNSLVQVKPEYSNINNGLGLFASRITVPNLNRIMKSPLYPKNSQNFREVVIPEGIDSLLLKYPELNFLDR